MSSKIYVPESGTAREVKKVYAPVYGVARSVKKVYKGVNGIARQVFSGMPSFDSVFANNTWTNIILACQYGVVPSTWTVGNQKIMIINGLEYFVNIIGKNHDSYANGGGQAPLTFQLHTGYVSKEEMYETRTNIGGWKDSAMRAYHLPQILSFMPLEIQNAIREVYKATSAGGESYTLHNTADKLFLLSEFEVFGVNTTTAPGEGEQYEYYAAGNSKVKWVNGSASSWWTRSPQVSNSAGFFAISATGWPDNLSANASGGVCFAFCF